MPSTDPRGPLQTITAIHDFRETQRRNGSGTVRPVTLDCGHTVELNATFGYRIGEKQRCFSCKLEEERS